MPHYLFASMILIGKGSGGGKSSWAEIILFLVVAQCSALLGMALCYLPYWWWLRNEKVLTETELGEQHPSEYWVVMLGGPAVAVGAIPTLFFVFAGMCVINEQPPLQRSVAMFLLLPTFFVGGHFGVGLIEAIAGVSLIVPFGHGPPGRERYIVSPRVRWAGVYKILLAVVLLSTYYYFSHGVAWWNADFWSAD